MGQPIPVPMPLKGLNTLDPFIEFDSGYARELTNYSIINGRIDVRPAVRVAIEGDNSLNQIAWIGEGSGMNPYVGIEAASGDIVNLLTGAVIGSVSIPGAISLPTTLKHVSLNLLIGVGEPRSPLYPFTGWTFNTLSITETDISSACSHKGRLYISDGTNIEYSAIGQITGTIPTGNKYPISQFMDGQSVLRMFSITAQPGNYATNVLVIFGDGGLVLVYQGSYPGDPAWTLIAKFIMPAPASRLSFVEKNGDIFVTTNLYAYWFRDLFNGGAQTAYDNRPSAPIDNLWKACTWSVNNGGNPAVNSAHCFYYEPLNCIVCQCYSAGIQTDAQLNKIADYNNDSVYFVYHLDYQSWSVWMMAPLFWPIIRISTGEYWGQQYVPSISKLDPAYMVDQSYDGSDTTDIDVETSWKTPYYYPQSGRNKNLSGTMPFFGNTVSGYLALIQAIYNLSDYNAPFGFWTQSSVTKIAPQIVTDGFIDVAALASKIYMEFCGVGGNGAGFSMQYTQKRKAGSTAVQNQTIYQASLNFDDGAPYPA